MGRCFTVSAAVAYYVKSAMLIVLVLVILLTIVEAAKQLKYP